MDLVSIMLEVMFEFCLFIERSLKVGFYTSVIDFTSFGVDAVFAQLLKGDDPFSIKIFYDVFTISFMVDRNF